MKPPSLPSSRKKRESAATANQTNSDKLSDNSEVLLLRSKRNSDRLDIDQNQKEDDYISIVHTSIPPTSETKNEGSITISVYKVFKNSKTKTTDAPSFELVTTENLLRSELGSDDGGKWVNLDISTMLSAWFKSPRENWGFIVRAKDENGLPFDVQHLKSEDDSKVCI